MRVLMLGWEFPPHISGGLGTACHGLTRGLAEEGVEVVFVVPRERGGEDARFVELRGLERAMGAASSADEAGPGAFASSMRVLAVDSALRPYEGAREYEERRGRGAGARPSGLPRSGATRALYGPDLVTEVGRYARAVGELALRERFDIVHAHDWMTFPAGLGLRGRAPRPLVCHVHATEHDRCGEHGDGRIAALERFGCGGADRVVCVSRYTARTVRERYGVARRRLRVVHNGVSETGDELAGEGPAPARDGTQPPTILFLGRVTAQKGPELFLAAAAEALRQEPGLRFLFAGDGDLLPRAIERAAELGIARSVGFTGFLDGADVARAYARADVYVLSSVSEPFGLTPLEALARGVPVVLSRRSGVSEVLRSAPRYEPERTDELAGWILALARSPRLRAQLVRRGLRELAARDWRRSARELIGVYEELVA